MGVFRFKGFSVDDTLCAMKTGTDAVLLGSWVTLPESGHVLDAGCGSGIIAMMLAFRNPSLEITGVEINTDAAKQAALNVDNLPFCNKVQIFCADLKTFASERIPEFDLIVSNPPYFSRSLKSDSQGRNDARHDSSLTHEQLVEVTVALLRPGGTHAVILPFQVLEDYRLIAASRGLFLQQRMDVKHNDETKPARSMAVFGFHRAINPEITLLTMHTPEGAPHPEYLSLTRDFYLFA